MTEQPQIRAATVADAEAMLTIYAPCVTDTAISFEIEVPLVAEYSERIRNVTAKYPWLVATSDSQVVGFAYASSHRSRAAYRYSVESSVYIDSGFQGLGIGSALYQRLFEELAKLGFKNVFAGTTLPNNSSVMLHEKFGFRES